MSIAARKTMPELSKVMVGSGGMKAEEIGKITVDGIKSGSFSTPCNFLGQTLAIVTAGVSPQRSFLMASLEISSRITKLQPLGSDHLSTNLHLKSDEKEVLMWHGGIGWIHN
ncbi:hypothetical protein QQP08_013370 [Theobroma cacao]|nr:hypothetical protein QQP08_013370 [Theobroma cacao]